MAESRTESSYHRSDSFTRLEAMQNVVHIYALTFCSNRGSTVHHGAERQKAEEVDNWSKSTWSCSADPTEEGSKDILFSPNHEDCCPLCRGDVLRAAEMLYLSRGCAHVGHERRALSELVDVVIVRHGARQEGGVHCSLCVLAAH